MDCICRTILIRASSFKTLSWLEKSDAFVVSDFLVFPLKARIIFAIGFFESFTSFGSGVLPGATTLDQIIKIIRDPFVAYRSVDNTVGIFKQVTSFDFVDDDGDFNLHWGIFDEYEKSGRGYEKGDLKISRKLQKSVIAPWYNTVKFFSPEDQLNMLDLLFKNSK